MPNYRRRVNILIVLLTSALSTALAPAIQADTVESKPSALSRLREKPPRKRIKGPESQQLVLGDWYDVVAKRQGLKKSICGYLVQVTDDWIVLGRRQYLISAGIWLSTKKGVSGYSDIGSRKLYYWIPRQAARIESRSQVTDASFRELFQNDVPALDGECIVHKAVRPWLIVQFLGRFAGIDDGRVRLNNGDTEEDVRKISLEDVLYIELRVPFDQNSKDSSSIVQNGKRPDESEPKIQQATHLIVTGGEGASLPLVADSQKFVVGDWYEVAVKRNKAEKQLSGYLVKVADEWIVLGGLLCQRETTKIVRGPDIPLISSLYSTVNEQCVYSKRFSWIPRQNVVIQNQSADSNGLFKKIFDGDDPELHEKSTRHIEIYQTDGTKESTFGDFVKQNPDGLTFKVQVSEHVVRKTRFSDVPLIGNAFTSRTNIVRSVEKNLPFEKVLYVEQMLLCDPPNVNPAASK